MKKTKMNPELAAQIRKMATNQNLYQHEIAAALDINQGRVSEVLNGKRFTDIPPVK